MIKKVHLEGIRGEGGSKEASKDTRKEASKQATKQEQNKCIDEILVQVGDVQLYMVQAMRSKVEDGFLLMDNVGNCFLFCLGSCFSGDIVCSEAHSHEHKATHFFAGTVPPWQSSSQLT